MESAVKGANGETRRGRPSRGAREALVAAARGLFVERDYDQVSVEDILERSGVSRGALYHHFPTKLDLFTAVWEAGEQRLIGELAARIPATSSPFEMLLGLARAYLAAAETDEELRRIGLGQSRAVLGWKAWRDASMGLGIGVVVAVVRAAIEAEELPDQNPETLAIVVLGAVIEAAMLVVDADDPAPARRRSESAVVALLEGLRR